MIIAIIGSDGVGKSTITKSVTKRLQEQGYDAMFCEYFENYFLLRFPLRIFSKHRKKTAEIFISKEGAQKKSFLFKAWPYLIYFDQLLLYLYLQIFKRNKLVITDRYAYSYLVTWKYYKLSNKILEKLYLIFPKPHLGYMLSVPSKAAFARKFKQARVPKDHYNAGFFESHTQEYLKIAKLFDFKLVDNTKPPLVAVETITGDLRNKL